MSIGFGTTHGSGGPDRIKTGLTTWPTSRTWAWWMYWSSVGGGGSGRMWDQTETSAAGMTNIASVTPDWTFQRNHDGGTNGVWQVQDMTGITNVWRHWAITYDGSSTANDPLMYLDGASQGVTETTTPTGSPVASGNGLYVGNRWQTDRNLDGRMAEFAVWDRILTPDEIGALADGFPPILFPTSLACYMPLVRGTQDYRGSAPTVTGTAVQPHPRMFGRGGSQIFVVPNIIGVNTPPIITPRRGLSGDVPGPVAVW